MRVLVLNFETLCINMPLHNEHDNLISAKSFLENGFNQLLVNNKIGVLG